MIILLPTLISVAWMVSSPAYRFSVQPFWVASPLLLFLLLQMSIDLGYISQTQFLSTAIRIAVGTLYGPLLFCLVRAELLQSDWVVVTPLFSIRRFWSNDELFDWVFKFHKINPSLPHPGPYMIDRLAVQAKGSIGKFKESYIEWVLLLSQNYDTFILPTLAFASAGTFLLLFIAYSLIVGGRPGGPNPLNSIFSTDMKLLFLLYMAFLSDSAAGTTRLPLFPRVRCLLLLSFQKCNFLSSFFFFFFTP